MAGFPKNCPDLPELEPNCYVCCHWWKFQLHFVVSSHSLNIDQLPSCQCIVICICAHETLLRFIRTNKLTRLFSELQFLGFFTLRSCHFLCKEGCSYFLLARCGVPDVQSNTTFATVAISTSTITTTATSTMLLLPPLLFLQLNLIG